MKKISEIINLQEFQQRKFREEEMVQEPPENHLPKSCETQNRILSTGLQSVEILSTNFSVDECKTLRNGLGKLLLIQDVYGKKIEDLNDIAESWLAVLSFAEVKMQDVYQAMMVFATENNKMPTPAEIIQHIKNPPQTTYDRVVCDCGKHYGVGIWTPEKRAEAYAKKRRLVGRENYRGDAKEWLESYEAAHGAVQDDYAK